LQNLHSLRKGGEVKRLILLLALVGCGSSEAAPKITEIVVKVAVIGESICDVSGPFQIAKERWIRDVGRDKNQIQFRMGVDIQMPDDRPDLRTLEHFWDGSLMEYWEKKIPGERGIIRLVLLPPLVDKAGYLYGGMANGTCKVKKGWAFANVEYGNTLRNALMIGHEVFGHLLGMRDDCRGSCYCASNCKSPDAIWNCGGQEQSIMCWSAAPANKSNPLAGYTAYDALQSQACLGLTQTKAANRCKSKFKGKENRRQRRRCLRRVEKRAPTLRSGGVVDEGFWFE